MCEDSNERRNLFKRRVRFLMSGDSGRREVSTFHAAALSATQFGSVAGVLSKCTLLPADSPNWRMGEVSV